MKNRVTKLFVYGTLRKGFRHHAYEYISRHFYLLADARVNGKLFDLGEYPAAIPASEAFFVKGELYDLKESGEFEWAIEQLDDYEGLNPAEGETKLFSRELTEVFYNDQSTQAWIYWYNDDITGQPLIQSGDIFDFTNTKHYL